MKEVRLILQNSQRIWTTTDYQEWLKRMRENPEIILPVTNWKINDVIELSDHVAIYLNPSDGYGNKDDKGVSDT